MSEKQEVPNQIGKMLGQLIEHQQHFNVMSTEDREWVTRNTPSAIALFAEVVKNRAGAKVNKLLRYLFDFITEAVEEFVVKNKFIEGKTTDGVSIVSLGENFKKNFSGKIERNVEAVGLLKIHKLLEPARNLPKEDEPGIISELDGRHETMLAHFFQLLAYKQRTGDYTWTIAYIRDENGNLWSVHAQWVYTYFQGWVVDAISVKNQNKWYACAQVVSH